FVSRHGTLARSLGWATDKNPETGTEFNQIRSRFILAAIRSGLSGLPRCSAGARLDLDCLGGLYGLGGLLDREMQHALVKMSIDGSILRLEWQEHRTVECAVTTL